MTVPAFCNLDRTECVWQTSCASEPCRDTLNLIFRTLRALEVNSREKDACEHVSWCIEYVLLYHKQA